MRAPPATILVRHGESQHHVLGLTGGWTDTPLTERGERQAKLVAARLKRELGDAPVRLITSDLKRAAQTATAISEALGVAVEHDDRLREHNNGEAANLTHDEARARWPRWYGRRLPLDEPAYANSETGRAFYARCGEFLDTLEDDGRTPIIVSHGGTLICLVGQWLGLTIEAIDPIGFEFHTTSITVLRRFDDDVPFGPAGRVIERLNDTSHLSEEDGGVSLSRLLTPPA